MSGVSSQGVACIHNLLRRLQAQTNYLRSCSGLLTGCSRTLKYSLNRVMMEGVYAKQGTKGCLRELEGVKRGFRVLWLFNSEG